MAEVDLEYQDEDSRITRKRWAKDPVKRKSQMSKAMPAFIEEYFGSVVPIAAAMGRPQAEVAEVIASSPELQELQEIAVGSIEARLTDRALYLAMNSKSLTACRWVLERKFPDKYGKAPVGAKESKSGFTAPIEDASTLSSVLDTQEDGDGEDEV